jgi:hypothetical protein
MRRADRILRTLALGLALLALSFADAALRSRSATADIERRAHLVAVLDLTDLALFTEARYTRHPSQADLHSAFQDHPMALEHFPSGSLVPARAPTGGIQ